MQFFWKDHLFRTFGKTKYGFSCTVFLKKEVINKIKDKSITHNIFRVQDSDSVMFGFYCIDFKECILAGKTLLDYTNLFSSNDYKNNEKTIHKYHKDKYVKSRI